MITSEDIIKELETLIYNEAIADHDEKTAIAATCALFNCLWLNFRGQLMYVPTVDREAITRRNESIFNEFTGVNQSELAIKYCLSVQQIYSIIKKMRAANTQKQGHNGSGLPQQKQPLALVVIYEYLPVELIKAGVSESAALMLSKKIALCLCLQFSGVSVCISDELMKKRQEKGGFICFNR